MRSPPMPALIRDLYRVVARLEKAYGRKFTPDGHLVGSIGEVIGAAHFGLTLTKHSTPGCDAISRCGKSVEIKATQGTAVAFRCKPDHLVVLRLGPRGGHKVIYNGPGKEVWDACGPPGSNGQRRIGIARLKALMTAVPKNSRLQPSNKAMERTVNHKVPTERAARAASSTLGHLRAVAHRQR